MLKRSAFSCPDPEPTAAAATTPAGPVPLEASLRVCGCAIQTPPLNGGTALQLAGTYIDGHTKRMNSLAGRGPSILQRFRAGQLALYLDGGDPTVHIEWYERAAKRLRRRRKRSMHCCTILRLCSPAWLSARALWCSGDQSERESRDGRTLTR